MTPSIVLLYDRTCPNVEATRTALREATAALGLPPAWAEHDLAGPELPPAWRGYGSPTVLVDGRDVAGEAPSAGSTCRIYPGTDGSLSRVPSPATLLAALRSPAGLGLPAGPLAVWPVLPGVVAALLPVVGCPSCWPLYTGLPGTLGLGFLLEADALRSLTTVALGLATVALALRARAQGTPHVFLLGLAGAAAILTGKFWWTSDLALAVGIVLLMAAAWVSPTRSQAPDSNECCACRAPADPVGEAGPTKEA